VTVSFHPPTAPVPCSTPSTSRRPAVGLSHAVCTRFPRNVQQRSASAVAARQGGGLLSAHAPACALPRAPTCRCGKAFVSRDAALWAIREKGFYLPHHDYFERATLQVGRSVGARSAWSLCCTLYRNATSTRLRRHAALRASARASSVPTAAAARRKAEPQRPAARRKRNPPPQRRRRRL
jgi:hypothetical protein